MDGPAILSDLTGRSAKAMVVAFNMGGLRCFLIGLAECGSGTGQGLFDVVVMQVCHSNWVFLRL